MSLSTQHQMDSVIDREVQELRNPSLPTRKLGDAVLAMQAPSQINNWKKLRWPVGVGAAATITGIGIAVASLSGSNAFAAELNAIQSAQEKQQVVYHKSTLFGENDKPALVIEYFIDRHQETMKQFTPDGKLEVVNVRDGKNDYLFLSRSPATGKPYGSVGADVTPHYGVETLGAILNSKLYKRSKVEKKAGLMFQGRLCDFYSIGNGYYQYWIDRNTRLPLQRDICAKDGSIWKRDVYKYPKSFDPSIFKAYRVPGLVYVERQSLGNPGEPAKVSRGQ